MFAKVILASRPTNGAPPIVTIHMRYPRIIHGEIMTHRVFSRNARSSRAVPVARMLEEIRNTPFVPWHWGKNQKGMQASEECDARVKLDPELGGGFEREEAWLHACDQALEHAAAFSEAGYHKQIVNRLIEPFSWIDTLITSTSWANFFHLRDHKDAEPHFRDLAVLVKGAIAGAEFQILKPGQWHTPYIQPEDRELAQAVIDKRSDIERYMAEEEMEDILNEISTARCARISYAPFDGDGSIKKELERYDLLVGSSPLHASPAEHQATPDTRSVYYDDHGSWENPRLAGNLGPGWIQFRKTLPGEYVAG